MVDKLLKKRRRSEPGSPSSDGEGSSPEPRHRLESQQYVSVMALDQQPAEATPGVLSL